MPKPLEHIWIAVIQGEHEAWKELVFRYSSLIYSVAKRAGLSSDDAEDCMQHTWLKLYDHRHKIKEPNKLPGWLITTTTRRAYRMLKHQHKTQVDIDENRPANKSLPDEELIRFERYAQLEAALEKLDPRCQKIVHFFFNSPHDQTYQDIARKLGISPNSLGPTKMRCLKKLREILIEMGYF